MTTEFDPQGRVYWGPHALSFPSAIWFDTSADPIVKLKMNVGGEGSASQYLQIASFDKTDPTNSLDMGGGSSSLTVNGNSGVSATTDNGSVDIQFDTTSLTQAQIDSLEALMALGEVNTASNQGGGEALFKQKTGSDLEFFSLDAVDGITLNKSADTINLSLDVATLTNNQLDDLRQSLLPSDAAGALTNDGSGNLAWVQDNGGASFSSTQGTIANTGSGQDFDLDIVASAVSDKVAQFMSANPTDPAAQALAAAMSDLADGSGLHDALVAHYGTNGGDLNAMQALIGASTDTDTRVVLSFVDTDSDGNDDILRVSIYAVDPTTGNTTGAPLGSTELPLSNFASGSLSAQTAGPLSGDGTSANPITITDADLAIALAGSAAQAAVQSSVQGELQNGAWQTPTLQSGWSNAGGIYAPLQYYKDALGRVSLQGRIIGGSGTGMSNPAFILPVGFRPGYTLNFLVPALRSSDEYARIQINTEGLVWFSGGTSVDGVAVNFDTVTFLAEN